MRNLRIFFVKKQYLFLMRELSISNQKEYTFIHETSGKPATWTTSLAFGKELSSIAVAG